MLEHIKCNFLLLTPGQKLKYLDKLTQKLSKSLDGPISLEICFMPDKRTVYALKFKNQILCHAHDINVFCEHLLKIFTFPGSPIYDEEFRIRNHSTSM